MPTITTQNWDGVTAPAIPAGWTVGTNVITQASNANSSPNSLFNNNLDATREAYYSTAQDGNGGNVRATTLFRISAKGTGGLNQCQVMARITSAPAATCYLVVGSDTGSAAGMTLRKRVSSVQTVLGSAVGSTATLATGSWYRAVVECEGTTIRGKLQRQSDGLWLNASGSFVSGETTFASVTDSDVSGQGYVGIRTYRFVSGDLHSFDDFTAETIDAAATFKPAWAAGSNRFVGAGIY